MAGVGRAGLCTRGGRDHSPLRTQGPLPAQVPRAGPPTCCTGCRLQRIPRGRRKSPMGTGTLGHGSACTPPTLPHLQSQTDGVGQGIWGMGGSVRGPGGQWGGWGTERGQSGGPRGSVGGGRGAMGEPGEQGVQSGVVHGTPCCVLKGNLQGGPQWAEH